MQHEVSTSQIIAGLWIALVIGIGIDHVLYNNYTSFLTSTPFWILPVWFYVTMLTLFIVFPALYNTLHSR